MAKCNNILIRDIPLFGCIAFGIIDRGTNVLQVRPISECPLSCIFCSTDAGHGTKHRNSEYMVDLQQLLAAFEWAASYKETNDIEAHIDTVGEPAMYPQLVELVEGLSKNSHVKTVSMQTNGMLLSPRLIDNLEAAGLSRINMSIESLEPELAKRIAGTDSYNLERVLGNAGHIARNTDIDLLIAPVWLPGINDKEIPGLIEFALRIGAGKRFPPLGIQKFLPHKYGRRPGIKPMDWDEFYSLLRRWEDEYGTKLVLKPGDFGSFDCKPIPRAFKRYEKVKVNVVGPGWMKGEMLAVARDRVVTVVDADRVHSGTEVNVRIERVVDGIYMARSQTARTN
ncbi:Coenzyme PQQ synthesis protein E [uncultured archaeon]|nr:Coenzyme PQQ synthesis protein E [uncultured archaeon]